MNNYRQKIIRKNEDNHHNIGNNNLRIFTQIVIGGIPLGLDVLRNQLSSINKQKSINNRDDGDETRHTHLIPRDRISSNEPGNDKSHYALMGLMIDIQDRIYSNYTKANQISSYSFKKIAYLINPKSTNIRLSPFYHNWDKLVNRGRKHVDHWINIGRLEENQGRIIAQSGINKIIDQGLNYLTSNPEVQELVEIQSVSLAEEIIEELRERAFSGDNYIEEKLRLFLHKTPRSQLPPPPETIIQSVIKRRKHKKLL
jgi:hypothetical protein